MRWFYLFAGCWLLAVAGCASTDAVKNATPVATHAPVSVDFVLVETSSSLTNLAMAQQLLQSKLITGLRATELFGTVSGDPTDTNATSGIKISARVHEVKAVSLGARVWFGGLAGQARVSAAVTISDLISGNQLQAFEVEGATGATAMAGTTDEAVERAAQLIVARVVALSRQTSE